MFRALSKFVFSSLGFLCLSFVVVFAMDTCSKPDASANTTFVQYDPFDEDGPPRPVRVKGDDTTQTPVSSQSMFRTPGGPAPQALKASGTRATTDTDLTVRWLRQANCSMTAYETGNDTNAGGFTVTSVANVQTAVHNTAGLTTTPNQFKSGCNDTMIGKASEQNVYAGRTQSGQVIGFQITEDNALEEAVIDLSGSATTHVGTSTYTSYPSITFAGFMVAVDLNGDGNQDILVTDAGLNGGTAGVKVLLGHGDGTFRTPVNYAIAGVAGAIVVDDMNKDGKLDLMVSSQGSKGSTTEFFPGNGDGTFGPPTVIANTYVGAMATGDLDGDGNKDIVTGLGTVMRGHGDGTFSAAVAISTSTTQRFGVPVLGDFNGDGKLDAAFNLESGVTIYLGVGDGSFTLGRSYASLYNSYYITVLDIDGDGNLDLVVGSGNSGALGPDQQTGGAWAVLMGNGDGTFQGTDAYPVVVRNEKPNQFVFGDFNGDGSVDMLTTANGSGLQVLANNGNGSFTQGALNPSTQPVAIAAALMNGDTKLDAVVLDYNNASSISSVGVAFGNGDGTFQTVTETPLPDQTGGVAIATGDFNGDGHPDVVVTTASTVYLYLNDGLGGLTAPLVVDSVEMNASNFGQSSALVVGDVNGDGKLDLVVSNELTAKVKIYLGNGNGTFGAATVYQPDRASSAETGAVALADMNGDGKLDLVFTSTDNSFDNPMLYVYPGKGDGTFGTVMATTLLQAASGIAVADLNGDGKPDVLIGSCCGQAYMMAVLGNGDGTFGAIQEFANAFSIAYVGAADLNGDGQADFVAVGIEGGTDGGIEVFLNLYGTSSAAAVTTTMLKASPNPATVGQTVTFTAIVTQTGGSAVPTGTVTFLDGQTTLGAGTLTAGTASFTSSGLSAGSHSITASYGGDTGDAASVSAALTEVVNAAAPTLAATATVLSASAGNAESGTSITLTAKVSETAGTSVPTGTITFLDGTTPLGSGNLTAGTATFATTDLAVGSHTLTASYGGDSENASSVSAGVSVTIVAAGTSSFSIALNPASGTVGQSGMVSTTLTITPAGGFNQPLTFACGNLPNHSICIFSPSTATPSGGAVTTTMTIETGLPTASVSLPKTDPGSPGLKWTAIAGIIGLGLFNARRKKGRRFFVFIVLGLIGVGLAGCGKGTPADLTAQGTSAVTVTATSGIKSQTVTYMLEIQ